MSPLGATEKSGLGEQVLQLVILDASLTQLARLARDDSDAQP